VNVLPHFLLLVLCFAACAPAQVSSPGDTGPYPCGTVVVVSANEVTEDGVTSEGQCARAVAGGIDLDPCCPDGFTGLCEFSSQVTCMVVCD
jgi:hypothetical protein